MRAYLFLVLFTAASLTAAKAQSFPTVPDNLQVLDLSQVKNYWVNMAPEPREPNLLNRSYDSLIVDYHRQVGERHRFLQAIQAGKHDRRARLVMLMHNIQTYLLKGDEENVAKLRAELAELEAEIAAEQAVQAEAQREQDEADRIERLIAATNRLAAALEQNGELPRELVQEVQEIVPFEEDCDIVPNLHREIIGHRLPIIIDNGHNAHINRPHVRNQPNSRPQRHGNKSSVPAAPINSRQTPRSPRQPQVRQPQVRQPQVRQPQVRQPQTRPARSVQPSTKQPSVRQPQVQQPRVQPATKSPAPQQPQSRPARR